MNPLQRQIENSVTYSEGIYQGAPGGSVEFGDPERGDYAAIIKTATEWYLVWAGSDDRLDWILNATAFPIRYDRAWVHAGMRWFHRRFWNEIEEELRPWDGQIICTGHSRGGGNAELSAWRLRDRGGVSLFTFGKPNVFAEWSRPRMRLDNQVSFVMGSDIVANIPAILFGPSRSQNKVYFSNQGTIEYNPTREAMLEDMELGELISDHSIIQYRREVLQYSRSFGLCLSDCYFQSRLSSS